MSERLRPGFFPHHTDECDIEYLGTKGQYRRYWCHTHHQWMDEVAKIVFVFDHDAPLYADIDEGWIKNPRPRLASEIGIKKGEKKNV